MGMSPMRFLIDAQLPPALVRLIRDTGHECEHVADILMRDADDSPIWNYAVEHDAAIITKDEDFAYLKAVRSGGPRFV